MNEKELLQAIKTIVQEETTSINNRLEKIETDVSEIKDRTLKIEERASKIEERTLKIEERASKIEERTLKIEERTSKIEERTLKIEITLENETNKNIQLLMEAQSLNAEKMKSIDLVLDDIESSVVATEAIVRQNIRDINVLKRKAQ